MKAPKFWYKDIVDAGPLSALLVPAGAAYGALTALRMARGKTIYLDIPVICVGNITAGGAGKTPIVAELATIAQDEGLTPHILMRGYGGRMKGPVLVDPTQHLATDVGDEALVLSRTAPVWVSRNRTKGAYAAIEHGANIIIMDDGFQNPSLHKDLSFIVIDGESGLGNGRLIPAGPLRESLKNGLKRAHGVIIMGDDKHNLVELIGKTCPIIRAETEPHCQTSLWGRDIVAFAGIGRPSKLMDSIEWLGGNIVSFHPYPDHFLYPSSEIEKLKTEAAENNALLVTTRKDFVRLEHALQSDITVVDIDIKWTAAEDMPHLLAPIFRKALESRKAR